MTLSGWYRTFFFFLLGQEDDDISLPWCPMSILYLLQFPYAFQFCIENLLLLIHVYIFPPKKLPLFLPYMTKRLEQILGNPCWNGNCNILTLLVSEDWHCTYCNSLRRELPCDLLFWNLQERIARFVITTDSMFLYTPSWEDYGVFQNTKDSSWGPKSLFHLPPPTTFSRRGGRDCRAMFLIMKITVS